MSKLKERAVVVSIENLLVEYRAVAEPFVALDIPKWEVDDGEQVAISGPSGSGKSTMLNVIAGLLGPTSGSVVVCGKQLAGLGEAERDHFRAAHIAYIFQTFNLLQGYTAIENVLIGATFSFEKPDRGVAKRLLEEVGLTHREHHYPAELSIGEQQRVAIARALVKKPKLILADEPTGSLDPRHAGEVVRLLLKECEEHESALILVSHEASIAAAFGRQVDFLQLNRALATAGGRQ
jgi:putative ABC transport system ATP-binding protein